MNTNVNLEAAVGALGFLGMGAPRLLIHEGETVTRFIIGHENSPLHRQTEFQLNT